MKETATRSAKIALPVALVLTLVSFLNMHHVTSVDYIADEFGFPLVWLSHVAQGIVQENVWEPSITGLVIDYLTWFAFSLVIVLVLIRVLSKGNLSQKENVSAKKTNKIT